MTSKDKDRQERSSISSNPLEESPRFTEVMALGQKLVEELGQEPPPDTLSRWMAHYIAELMDAATNAPSAKRAAFRRECFETVLELWSHQADLPAGRRPFEDLEPIGRALESLDPSNETPAILCVHQTWSRRSGGGSKGSLAA